MNNLTLADKLIALRDGNRAAFEEIYHELKSPIYTIIYRILYDKAGSEDIMQEVFIKLFRSPPDAQIKNPRAWIFRMARNLAIDTWRKRSQTEAFDENFAIVHPFEDSIGISIDVEAAMRYLSHVEREIITLHINAGLKFKEIAEIVDKPLGTVLWCYQKSIGKLRNELIGEKI